MIVLLHFAFNLFIVKSLGTILNHRFNSFTPYTIEIKKNEEYSGYILEANSDILVVIDILLLANPVNSNEEEFNILINYFDDNTTELLGFGTNQLRIPEKYINNSHQHSITLKCLTETLNSCVFTFIIRKDKIMKLNIWDEIEYRFSQDSWIVFNYIFPLRVEENSIFYAGAKSVIDNGRYGVFDITYSTNEFEFIYKNHNLLLWPDGLQTIEITDRKLMNYFMKVYAYSHMDIAIKSFITLAIQNITVSEPVKAVVYQEYSYFSIMLENSETFRYYTFI